MKRAVAVLTTTLLATNATADIIHADDVIIQGSSCVGFDCVNGENFGFDVVRSKENNIRLHFDDTSTSATFPDNDWRIVINDTSNGGADYFAIEDSSAGRQIFRLDAGAPTDALRLDSGGDFGIGTANPVVDLHIASGNTPTTRLEQNGSSGFAPQTWDVAGNEANFFIRDVTNGSRLPFKIKPNAPSDSLFIEGITGDIGLGTTSPTSNLEIRRAGQVSVELEDSNTGGDRWLMLLEPSGVNEGLSLTKAGTGVRELLISDKGVDIARQGRVTLELSDTQGETWDVVLDSAGGLNGLSFTRAGSGVREFRVANNGDIFTSGTQLNVPDFVFEPDYELMPLAKLESFIAEFKHLPEIAPAEEVHENGLNVTGMQMKLLTKIEELTLHVISQEKAIAELKQRLAEMESRNET